MKLIEPNKFYDLLITNNLLKENEYLDENGNIKHTLDLEVFNQTGQWLENQVNYLNMEGDDSEITYGNFGYMTSVVDDGSYVIPQYTSLFRLEIIAFEKDRDKVIELFDRYAAGLNYYSSTMEIQNPDDENIKDVYDILVLLGENSLPTYSQKMDIAGAERFIVGLTLLVRVTKDVITTKNIKFEIYNPENTEVEENLRYEELKYISFDMSRSTDLNVDMAAGYEKKYYPQKSDFNLTIGCFYMDNYFSKKIMSYIIDEENLEQTLKIRYTDNLLGIVKIFDMYIAAVNPSISYGSPISYTATLKKIQE